MSHWQRTISRSINQDLLRLRSRKKEYDLLATGKKLRSWIRVLRNAYENAVGRYRHASSAHQAESQMTDEQNDTVIEVLATLYKNCDGDLAGMITIAGGVLSSLITSVEEAHKRDVIEFCVGALRATEANTAVIKPLYH